MVIQIDVDGVLADFRAGWAKLALEKFGVALPLQETSWDQLYGSPLREGWSDQLWDHIKQSRTFWGDLEPLASREEFNCLDEVMHEHDVYFVTSRVGKLAKYQTFYWLRENIMWSYVPTVIISSRKAEAANALGAHYVIDDKPGNVLATYYLSPPERKVYIRDHPFNRFDHSVAGKRIRRVANLGAFLSDIKERR